MKLTSNEFHKNSLVKHSTGNNTLGLVLGNVYSCSTEYTTGGMKGIYLPENTYLIFDVFQFIL